MTGKRRKGRPIGETIGGIVVGFDQQVFRTTPPVQELIVNGQPVRGLSGQDGSEFEVVFPGDGPPEPAQLPARPESAEASEAEPGDTP